MTIDLPVSAAPARGRPLNGAVPDGVIACIRRLHAEQSAPVSGYVYDLAAAANQARRMRAALPTWTSAYYAVKANSYQPVLEALAPAVDGFEVASVREMEAALTAAARTGRTARIAAAGPGKTATFLRALCETAAQADVMVNVESVLELRRLDEIAKASGRRIRAALRVNPNRVPISGSLAMGGTATAFGVAEADVPAALEVAGGLDAIELVGFHIHAVSNNIDAMAHADYVRWCLDFSMRAAQEAGFELQVVDTGGGFGVDFAGGPSFDVATFGAALEDISPPPGVRVLFEPGRWPVAECGYYAAEVTDLKFNHGTWFVILRGGINHFQLPTSWPLIHNFAVLPIESWPHDWERPTVTDAPITVVGELCTPEDTLARDITVDRVRVGDIVVFPTAGSYGWEFAMPEFLGHPQASRWSV
ncbi:alanine racemase [Tsukamurella ocularis]|uniref:alanine racemase n=1 Tax=Tsukamurella ocularis TaxID=1970234 RepID=UPI00216A80BC|nr:alanine racemase [Tsukamurella ocularis]MCS3780422.1 diaminopimelate decarboxylase [Tsukamurella ocularis]MCS3786023.1 diaminopimelate decarboxylase [Tsukamurella ocularis]MCS3849387.1 diaminopimelate decarboxylase [Tsukamurella ocularis]